MEQISEPEKTSTAPASAQHKGHMKEYASIGALVIAGITALLSFYGRTYYGGYNSYWGLPEDLFSLSQEQSIIGGVIAYLLVFMKVLLPYVMTLFFTVTGLIFMAMLFSLRCVRQWIVSLLRRPIDWLQPKVIKHLHASDTIDRIITRLYTILLAIAASVFLVLVIAKTTQWASERGNEIARQRHEEILSGKPSIKPFPFRATIVVSNPAKGFDQYSGHLIQTSATHCALYSKATGITIFPLANVARMVIHENKAGVKQ
jgi:hypothetical protein